MKTDISNLISDIDELITSGVSDEHQARIEPAFETFLNGVRAVLDGLIVPKENTDKPYLRPSNLGTPDRKLWYTLNNPDYATAKGPDPAKLRSYAFGSIIEHLLVALIKIAGYEVTSEQSEIEYEGVKGRMDLKIGSTVIDAKSVSPWVFGKYRDGSLFTDDMWGYAEQLSLYASDGSEAAILAMDKSSGDLALVPLDPFSRVANLKGLIQHKRQVESFSTPPSELCYPDKPYGKGGNMEVAKGCYMCPFLKQCRGDFIRTFRYSNGNVHLTKIVRMPDVPEVTP